MEEKTTSSNIHRVIFFTKRAYLLYKVLFIVEICLLSEMYIQHLRFSWQYNNNTLPINFFLKKIAEKNKQPQKQQTNAKKENKTNLQTTAPTFKFKKVKH